MWARKKYKTLIEGKLCLKVNEKKSAVWLSVEEETFTYQHHRTTKIQVRIAKQSLKRMKAKVRENSSRKMPYSMEYWIKNNGLVWLFRVGRYSSFFGDLNAGYIGDFAYTYGKSGRSQGQRYNTWWSWRCLTGKLMSVQTVERAISESQIAQYYTEPSATLSREAKGWGVYTTVMNSCVINLSWTAVYGSVRTVVWEKRG